MKTKIIPFNKELAEKIQAGEIEGKIKTKDGRDARIICWDYKVFGDKLIIAIVKASESNEVCLSYNYQGEVITFFKNEGNVNLELALEVPDEYHGKYIYEFDEDPKKFLHSDAIERIATKVTIDGFVTRNRYGNTDYDKQTFKPFDKVMVSQKGWNYWIPSIYRNQTPDGKHICIDNLEYDLCKPYEKK